MAGPVSAETLNRHKQPNRQQQSAGGICRQYAPNVLENTVESITHGEDSDQNNKCDAGQEQSVLGGRYAGPITDEVIGQAPRATEGLRQRGVEPRCQLFPHSNASGRRAHESMQVSVLTIFATLGLRPNLHLVKVIHRTIRWLIKSLKSNYVTFKLAEAAPPSPPGHRAPRRAADHPRRRRRCPLPPERPFRRSRLSLASAGGAFA